MERERERVCVCVCVCVCERERERERERCYNTTENIQRYNDFEAKKIFNEFCRTK